MCDHFNSPDRQCVICNRPLVGRSDKRFCDIQCKNRYHSEIRKSMKTIRSETLKILTKNYIILAGVMNEGRDACLIDKLALEKLGFHFNYVTEATSRQGIIHYGVFDLNYRFAHNKRVLITIDKERSAISPFLYKRWNREIREQAT